MCLDSLAAVVGHYTAEDLMVASRRSSKGVWITEVWTLRDFKPKEIRIAPVTTQMKESHLTSGSSSPVGLPSHGVGKHPSGSSIALDGRGRSSMHPAGVCGEAVEKRGSLFWCIQRTHIKEEANTVEESCTFGTSVEVNVLGTKQTVKWNTSDLPAIPILTNKKAIKQHTQVKVFLAKPKDKQ